MTEFCSISIVGLGILAIGLHLSALIKLRCHAHRRLPTRYLPRAHPLLIETKQIYHKV